MAATTVYDRGSWRVGEDGSVYRRGRMKYSNGDVYHGEWLNSKRHGNGSLEFSTGGNYIGEFYENYYHGFGLLNIPRHQHPLTKQWIDGEKYEGEFQKGNKHGRGIKITTTGESYSGHFENGKYHGQGICTYANTDVYEGNWRNGMWSGDGELRQRNGSKYIGCFENGKYHGYGRFLYGHNGCLGTYYGDYVNGVQHGKGRREFSDGTTYDGDWHMGEMHGPGILITSEYTLIGTFCHGKLQGLGSKSFSNGDLYKGEFVDGEFQGKGVFNHHENVEARSKRVYSGEFMNGKRHGLGQQTFANGNIYHGEWKEGVMHGEGELTSVTPLPQSLDGGQLHTKYKGSFKDGFQSGNGSISCSYYQKDKNLVLSTTKEFEFPIGSGFWHFGRGEAVYSGGFLQGCFHGKGILKSPDGKIATGSWEMGKFSGLGERLYLPIVYEQINDNAGAFISKNGSPIVWKLGLYRVCKYVGEFVNNVRHGHGTILYENGDKITGLFVKGFPEGTVTYCFASGKERMAEYNKGKRIRWLPEDTKNLSCVC